MSGPDFTCAILFADVIGSTSLFERLGDTVARRTISRCLSMLTDLTQEEGGMVVKTIGDEFLARFPTADAALIAACRMHSLLDAEVTSFPVPIAVRIGFDHGPVILEDGDVFGDTINLAARMVAVAKARKIIITERAARALSGELSERARKFDHTKIKGKQELMTIYQVVWEKDDVTHMADTRERQATRTDLRLTLTYLEKDVVLDPDSPVVTIGRSDECDLTIDTRFLSRLRGALASSGTFIG